MEEELIYELVDCIINNQDKIKELIKKTNLPEDKSKKLKTRGISSKKNQLKGVKSPCFPPPLYNLPDTNCNIKGDIAFKLCKVLLENIKLLIKAPVFGARKIGAKILQKKNFAMKAFSSKANIFGNFLRINIKIILQRHLIEYGNRCKSVNNLLKISLIIITTFMKLS